jgi:cation diffusion facilitator CzcD-associated flavoprotein CzcO
MEERMNDQHVDVLIVGAGISGIGAAYHLQTKCPDRSYAIFEGRPDLGGTWDLFRYPGVRSDSDMHTLGFSFKPWKEAKAIADGPSILRYLHETAEEFGIEQHIRYQHWVTSASWDSTTATWTVTATRRDTGATTQITCNFLFMCSGYYSYKEGYTPDLPGIETFRGPVVHPQQWPEDLNFEGKRVLVIGSGATAMTLVPAMASTAAHVVMLQRSPTYVVARPDTDVIADKLRTFLPEKMAYALTRRKNVLLSEVFYKRTRTHPEKVKQLILGGVRKALGPDYDVDTHFTPSYNPWDQRMCLVPNGDLFEAIKTGKASVVTDHIERFTPTGVRLTSGEEIEADIIVTATGLTLVSLGEVEFSVDGRTIDFSQTWTYKGMAYSDVPNLVSTFGYINASWTLRADVVAKYVCRLLNHMKEIGVQQATPRLRPEDGDMPQRSWIDDFPAGYMMRAMHLMPKQGDREPWVNPQLISRDKKMIVKSPVDDGVMQFTRVAVPTS